MPIEGSYKNLDVNFINTLSKLSTDGIQKSDIEQLKNAATSQGNGIASEGEMALIKDLENLTADDASKVRFNFSGKDKIENRVDRLTFDISLKSKDNTVEASIGDVNTIQLWKDKDGNHNVENINTGLSEHTDKNGSIITRMPITTFDFDPNSGMMSMHTDFAISLDNIKNRMPPPSPQDKSHTVEPTPSDKVELPSNKVGKAASFAPLTLDFGSKIPEKSEKKDKDFIKGQAEAIIEKLRKDANNDTPVVPVGKTEKP
jgi:hypothetical protein